MAGLMTISVTLVEWNNGNATRELGTENEETEIRTEIEAEGVGRKTEIDGIVTVIETEIEIGNEEKESVQDGPDQKIRRKMGKKTGKMVRSRLKMLMAMKSRSKSRRSLAWKEESRLRKGEETGIETDLGIRVAEIVTEIEEIETGGIEETVIVIATAIEGIAVNEETGVTEKTTSHRLILSKRKNQTSTYPKTISSTKHRRIRCSLHHHQTCLRLPRQMALRADTLLATATGLVMTNAKCLRRCIEKWKLHLDYNETHQRNHYNKCRKQHTSKYPLKWIQ